MGEDQFSKDETAIELENVAQVAIHGRFPFAGTGRPELSVRKWNASVSSTGFILVH